MTLANTKTACPQGDLCADFTERSHLTRPSLEKKNLNNSLSNAKNPRISLSRLEDDLMDSYLENTNEIKLPSKPFLKAFSVEKGDTCSSRRTTLIKKDLSLVFRETPLQSNLHLKNEEDSLLDDENLSENKESINTMVLKTKMNVNIRSAIKNLDSECNSKSYAPSPRCNVNSSTTKEQAYTPTSRNFSGGFSHFVAEDFKVEKMPGPKSFYNANNGPISPGRNHKPSQVIDAVLSDVLCFSGEHPQYDILGSTQKIVNGDSGDIEEIKKKAMISRKQTRSATQPVSTLKNIPSDEELVIGKNTSKLSRVINKKDKASIRHFTLADLDEMNYSDILLKAIFDHNLAIIKKVLRKREFPFDLNQQDGLGNTPLMLATKLAYKDVEYLEIVKCLLSYGADPKIKDANGWSCIDEAVSQANSKLLSILFDGLAELKTQALNKQRDHLLKVLEQTPDFYIEMKWDFESSVIPFVSKLAPSDTFKIWKFGKYIRMDYTLTGFKRLKAKRRNMSIIFNSQLNTPLEYHSAGPLFSLNREKNEYTNILQNIDPDEKKLVIRDLLKAEPLQGNFDIKSCTWIENKETSFFGTPKSYKINEWDTKRYDFKIIMEYVVFKKSKALFKQLFESYKLELMQSGRIAGQANFKTNDQEILRQIKENSKQNKEKLDKKSQPPPEKEKSEEINFKKLSKLKIDVETFENAKVSEKKTSASLWVAQKFSVSIQNFLPVLEFLSKGNNLLQKLESLLSRKDMKSIITDNTFPVKLQVPLSLSVKANVSIITCKPLPDPNVYELFFLPKNCKYVDRKDAQKTLIRPKKRLVLINTLI